MRELSSSKKQPARIERDPLRGRETVMSSAVRARALDVGVSEPDVEGVLSRLLSTIRKRPRGAEHRFGSFDPRTPQTPGTLLRELMSFLDQIEGRWAPDTYQSMRDTLFLMNIAFPRLVTEPDFRTVFSRYANVLIQTNPTGSWRFSGRIIGTHFEEYLPYLNAETEHELRQRLRNGYPLGMLPSVPIQRWTGPELERFDVEHAVEADGLRLVSTPVSLDRIDGSIRETTSNVCSHAEGYFASALDVGLVRMLTNQENLPIGFLKEDGEGTFLATSTVLNDGKAVLLKGGIYDVFAAKPADRSVESDKTVYRVNDFHGLSCVPLRMWRNSRADDSSGVELEAIELERIVEKAAEWYRKQSSGMNSISESDATQTVRDG